MQVLGVASRRGGCQAQSLKGVGTGVVPQSNAADLHRVQRAVLLPKSPWETVGWIPAILQLPRQVHLVRDKLIPSNCANFRFRDVHISDQGITLYAGPPPPLHSVRAVCRLSRDGLKRRGYLLKPRELAHSIPQQRYSPSIFQKYIRHS